MKGKGRRVAGNPSEGEGQQRSESRMKAVRDLTVFLCGTIGFVHEVFFTDTDRPFLLILTASMMGLPAAFRLDEFRRTGK